MVALLFPPCGLFPPDQFAPSLHLFEVELAPVQVALVVASGATAPTPVPECGAEAIGVEGAAAFSISCIVGLTAALPLPVTALSPRRPSAGERSVEPADAVVLGGLMLRAFCGADGEEVCPPREFHIRATAAEANSSTAAKLPGAPSPPKTAATERSPR